jgi:hypothetical protein
MSEMKSWRIRFTNLRQPAPTSVYVVKLEFHVDNIHLVDHAPCSSRRPGASRPSSLTCALAVTEGLNTGAGMNFSALLTYPWAVD